MREAVIVAVSVEVKELALAVKLIWVLPAGTVTEAGTVKAEVVSARETRLPPDGAAAERDTVQAVLVLETRLPDAHCREEIEIVMVKVRESV